MHFKVCIVILAAAAYITYAGDQSLYIFDEDGEDVENLIPRVRRDGGQDDEFQEEYFKHVLYCCNETEIIFKKQEDSENFHNITSECYQETENITDTRDHQYCLLECVLEMMNMTDEDGNIVENPQEQVEEIYFFDSETVLQNIVTKCPAWSKEAAKNIQGEYECNPQALYFWFCSFDMRNLYCPDDKKIEGEICDSQRAKLKTSYQYY